MKKFLLSTVLFNICLNVFALNFDKEKVTLLNSEKGKYALINSLMNNDGKPFLKQIKYFTYQNNPFDCGPTTIAIALNALDAKAPQDKNFTPNGLFTQDNLFTQNVVTQTKITMESVRQKPGINLLEAENILNSFENIKAIKYYTSYLSKEKAHELLMNSIRGNNSIIIINFLRSRMGETGGGHFSPIGAYDSKTDSFLVMDVSVSKKWGLTWVPYDLLYQGMNTMDGDKSRGFIIVKKNK